MARYLTDRTLYRHGIVNKSAVEKSPKIANGKNASELTEWSEAERRKFRCGAKRKAAS